MFIIVRFYLSIDIYLFIERIQFKMKENFLQILLFLTSNPTNSFYTP